MYIYDKHTVAYHEFEWQREIRKPKNVILRNKIIKKKKFPVITWWVAISCYNRKLPHQLEKVKMTSSKSVFSWYMFLLWNNKIKYLVILLKTIESRYNKKLSKYFSITTEQLPSTNYKVFGSLNCSFTAVNIPFNSYQITRIFTGPSCEFTPVHMDVNN